MFSRGIDQVCEYLGKNFPRAGTLDHVPRLHSCMSKPSTQTRGHPHAHTWEISSNWHFLKVQSDVILGYILFILPVFFHYKPELLDEGEGGKIMFSPILSWDNFSLPPMIDTPVC